MLITACIIVLFLVASTALFVALRPLKGDKQLLRAFEALESDFEDLRENVQSALGRVSRLKRSMMEMHPEGAGAEAGSTPPSAEDPALNLNQRQSTLQARILARRNRVVG